MASCAGGSELRPVVRCHVRRFGAAPGGMHFGVPSGAILRHFHARWHFQNAVGRTLSGKSRPMDTISYIHRAWQKEIPAKMSTFVRSVAGGLFCWSAQLRRQARFLSAISSSPPSSEWSLSPVSGLSWNCSSRKNGWIKAGSRATLSGSSDSYLRYKDYFLSWRAAVYFVSIRMLPHVTGSAPRMTFGETGSFRNRNDRQMVMTTFSLSIGATQETSIPHVMKSITMAVMAVNRADGRAYAFYMIFEVEMI